IERAADQEVPPETTPPGQSVARGLADEEVVLDVPRPQQDEILPTAPVHAGGELIHVEQPDYPFKALRAGTEGQVVLAFTITTEGNVTDAEVLQAQPRGVFESAALSAVSQWRYRPF